MGSQTREQPPKLRGFGDGFILLHHHPQFTSDPDSITVTMSASLAPECNEVKEYVFQITKKQALILTQEYRRYDQCFLKWYSESEYCPPTIHSLVRSCVYISTRWTLQLMPV